MKNKIKEKIDIWAEGDYIDLWTVVHFFTGILLGFTPFIFDFPIPLTWIFAGILIVLILWELFEYIRKIKETAGNRIIDILIAVIGFGLTVYVYPSLSPAVALGGGIILLIIYSLLNLSGWLAYRVRSIKK